MTTTLTVDHPDLDGGFLQVGGLSELVGVCGHGSAAGPSATRPTRERAPHRLTGSGQASRERDRMCTFCSSPIATRLANIADPP